MCVGTVRETAMEGMVAETLAVVVHETVDPPDLGNFARTRVYYVVLGEIGMVAVGIGDLWVGVYWVGVCLVAATGVSVARVVFVPLAEFARLPPTVPDSWTEPHKKDLLT